MRSDPAPARGDGPGIARGRTSPDGRILTVGLTRSTRDAVERVLWRRGWWIDNQGSSGSRSLRRFVLPSAVTSLAAGGGSRRFIVPTELVTTPYGFAFGKGGWHPYVATLEEAESTGRWSYEGSLLERFHRVYQPETLADALPHGPDPEAWASARGLPHSWPIVRDLWLIAQRTFHASLKGALTCRPEDRSPHVGPLHEQAARGTYERLLKTFCSMSEHGYAPERFDLSKGSSFDGYAADGYFLWDGSAFRFMLLHGHHRLGVARHLGVEEVEVYIRRRYVPVVDKEQVRRSFVATVIGEGTAESIFDAQMNSSGREKATALGLR